MKKIDGYKTYLVMAIASLAWIAFMLGAIDWETFIQILPLLGIASGFTLRHAIKKLE